MTAAAQVRDIPGDAVRTDGDPDIVAPRRDKQVVATIRAGRVAILHPAVEVVGGDYCAGVVRRPQQGDRPADGVGTVGGRLEILETVTTTSPMPGSALISVVVVAAQARRTEMV